MRQARLSRGAFYSHFHSLDELLAVVAAQLASAIRDFSPAGVEAADPVARIAAGCAAFIGAAQRDLDWGALVARGVSHFPIVASAARERLTASLRLAEGEGRLTPFSLEVGFDLVFGAVVEATRSASDARLSPRDVADVVGGFCARSASRRAKSSWRCVSSIKKRLRSVTRLRSQSPTDPEGIFNNGDKSRSF